MLGLSNRQPSTSVSSLVDERKLSGFMGRRITVNDRSRKKKPCTRERKKNAWEEDEHACGCLPDLPSPASSLPRSSNPSRRAVSTAQIYDARNSRGEIRVLQYKASFEIPPWDRPRARLDSYGRRQNGKKGEKRRWNSTRRCIPKDRDRRSLSWRRCRLERDSRMYQCLIIISI